MGYKKELPCESGVCPYEQYGGDCDRFCGDAISKAFYSALSEITNIEHVRLGDRKEQTR